MPAIRSLSPSYSGQDLPLFPFTITTLFWTTSLWTASVPAKVTPFLPQGFMFDWTPDGQTPPTPTTAQCDTIHIKWGRGTEEGPNPTAPYYLQIYTSTFIVPFVIEAGSGLNFDWVVPFIPGTQYQICMFDSKGVSGGCQAVYTVYQAPNTTLDNPPTCFNLTYPSPDKQLGVTALVDDGPFSQFGWIDQCTDLSVAPTNGTPPYTLTVAPALHPPYNITSQDVSPINWTVSLSWGAPFFVSLVDSTGMSWASGPLHSGGGGTTDCLSLDAATPTKKTIAPVIAIGAGLGGLGVGILIGVLSAFAYAYWPKRHRPRRLQNKGRESTGMLIASSPTGGHYRDLPSDSSRDGLMRDNGYIIEPFVLPSETEFGALPRINTSPAAPLPAASGPSVLSPTAISPTARSPTSIAGVLNTVDSQPSSSGSRSAPSVAAATAMSPTSLVPPRPHTERASSHVYVVHHDGGGAPISVYTEDGTEVVELPPRYPYENQAASSSPLADPARRRPVVPPEKPSVVRRAVS